MNAILLRSKISVFLIISGVYLFFGTPHVHSCKSKTLKTCKVVALKDLFLEGHSVTIFHVSDNERIVLADWSNSVDAHLLILEKVEEKWLARFLCGEMWGKGWKALRDVPNRNERFAIVDHSVEAPGWELMVLFSEDDGASWELRGCIKKPHYYGLLESFEVSSARDASVVINHRDSVDPEIPSGLYVSTTQNGGRTWSKPRMQFLPAMPSRDRPDVTIDNEKELLLKLPK